jgi:L-fucose mutarotase/ribose pyranase (RbsD/FucU family)
MLKGLDPLLGPDLLHVLAAMGHGDEIVIADGNFPAASLARRLVRLEGVDAPRALRAILSVPPLDTFVAAPAWNGRRVTACWARTRSPATVSDPPKPKSGPDPAV